MSEINPDCRNRGRGVWLVKVKILNIARIIICLQCLHLHICAYLQVPKYLSQKWRQKAGAPQVGRLRIIKPRFRF